MIAQSELRIAECKITLAKYAYIRKNKDKKQQLIYEAKKICDTVKKRYKDMPQELF